MRKQDGITSNLPMRRAYVALIVLSTVFSMAWCKIIIKRSLSWYTMEYTTRHLYFLGILTSLYYSINITGKWK